MAAYSYCTNPFVIRFEFQDLVDLGARKVFFVNSPSLGCCPHFLALQSFAKPGTCNEDINRDTVLFNAAMQTALELIRQTSPGFVLSVQSSYGFTRHVIANTASYGENRYFSVSTVSMFSTSISIPYFSSSSSTSSSASSSSSTSLSLRLEAKVCPVWVAMKASLSMFMN